MQEVVRLIERPRACDVDKDQAAQVQGKPFRVLGSDREQARFQAGGRGDVQFALMVMVAITPSQERST